MIEKQIFNQLLNADNHIEKLKSSNSPRRVRLWNSFLFSQCTYLPSHVGQLCSGGVLKMKTQSILLLGLILNLAGTVNAEVPPPPKGGPLTMWTSAMTVEKIIPPSSGYTLHQRVGWPTVSQKNNALVVTVPYKVSHCVTAVLTTYVKHLVDLSNAGHFKLTSEHIGLLNSWKFRNAFNSNGWTIAYVNQYLGGVTFTNPKLAKRGDVLKIDRSNGTGHIVIFDGLKNGEFCYWGSNANTNGVAKRCESNSGKSLVFSRFTKDLNSIPKRLDHLAAAYAKDKYLLGVIAKGGNAYTPLKAGKSAVINLTKDPEAALAAIAPPSGVASNPADIIKRNGIETPSTEAIGTDTELPSGEKKQAAPAKKPTKEPSRGRGSARSSNGNRKPT